MTIVVAPPESPAQINAPWWDPAYSHRLRMSVMTADATASGYSLSVRLDHAAMVNAGTSLASGDDVRVVRFDGASWAELDRVLIPGTTGLPNAWNTSNTKIWFRSQSAMTAASVNTEYWIYHGNPLAGAPPRNGDNVFDLHDDFDSGVISSAKWTQSETVNNIVDPLAGGVSVHSTNIEANSFSGLRTQATFGRGRIAEFDLAMVTNPRSNADHWNLTPGVSSIFDIGIYGPFRGVPKPVCRHGNPVVCYGSTSISSATFSPIRVATSLETNGRIALAQDGAVRAATGGVTTGATTLQFTVAWPGAVAGSSFDMRFDNIVIRKFVATEPVVALDVARDDAVGVTVDPTLTFSVSGSGSCNGVSTSPGAVTTPSTLDMGPAGSASTINAAQELSVTTNAAGGFAVSVASDGALTSGAATIADLAADHSAPVAWPGSAGFGYSTSEADLPGGIGDRFTSGGLRFAGLSRTALPVSAAATTNGVTDTTCMLYRLTTDETTASGRYTANISYTAVGTY